MNPVAYTIREAKRSDCQMIRALIQDLADFENMSEGPKITYEDLEKDGFDTIPPLFISFVATVEEKVVGYSIFYYTYSTWEGRSLHLEDLYVSTEYRNKHIGSALFKKVSEFAMEKKCARMDFSVLDWNPASEFYKKKGAININNLEGWNVYRMDQEALKKICQT